VLDPTLALGELGLPRAELAQREPGLATLPRPRSPAAFSDAGPGSRRRRHPGGCSPRRSRLIGLLHRAGVPIVAGTDQAVARSQPAPRARALRPGPGFTPMEALQARDDRPGAGDEEGQGARHGRGRQSAPTSCWSKAIRSPTSGRLRRIRVVVAGGRAYDPAALWAQRGLHAVTPSGASALPFRV